MVIWIIGLSGSGKTTTSKRLYSLIKPKIPNLVHVDGDLIRSIWQEDLGHSIEGRKKNSDRIVSICKFLDDQNIHVLCSVLSIFPDVQKNNRSLFSEYFQVFLDVPKYELLNRDPHGFYKKAELGQLKNFIGYDIPFPTPVDSNLTLKNTKQEHIAHNVDLIIQEARFKRFYI